MKDLLFPEPVVDFLKKNWLASVATLSPDNMVMAAIVYYALDEQYHIIFSTSRNSRKLKNIEHNGKIALVVAQEKKSLTLQIEGTAEKITETSKKAELVERIAHASNANPDVPFFPPTLTLSAKSPMEFVSVTIRWFKFSSFESHENNIYEGAPANWKSSSL